VEEGPHTLEERGDFIHGKWTLDGNGTGSILERRNKQYLEPEEQGVERREKEDGLWL
jgi:hypothetical protein